jgi:hypothetical protein
MLNSSEDSQSLRTFYLQIDKRGSDRKDLVRINLSHKLLSKGRDNIAMTYLSYFAPQIKQTRMI